MNPSGPPCPSCGKGWWAENDACKEIGLLPSTRQEILNSDTFSIVRFTDPTRDTVTIVLLGESGRKLVLNLTPEQFDAAITTDVTFTPGASSD